METSVCRVEREPTRIPSSTEMTRANHAQVQNSVFDHQTKEKGGSHHCLRNQILLILIFLRDKVEIL